MSFVIKIDNCIFVFKYGDSPIDYDEITCELKANVDKCFAEQRLSQSP